MTGIKLRGYQERAIGKLRPTLARHRRVMLYSPTGSGKTEMAFVMVVGAVAKGRKVVFIANRKELVRQASRRLDAAGIAHGILQAENTRSLDAKVRTSTITTMTTNAPQSSTPSPEVKSRCCPIRRCWRKGGTARARK